MTDRIDSLKSSLQVSAQKQESQLRQKLEKSSQAQDRVTLSDQDSVEQTYGPGIKVGSAYDLLRNLVIKTLQDQGVPVQISSGDTSIDLTTMTPEEAQELIAEDGYFGVEQTSDRIVDFAINAFGSDPAKLEQMRAAIDQGFKDAEAAFGGALPEISQDTYNAIMDKLDVFAAQFEAAKE